MNQLNSRRLIPSILLLFLLGIVFSCNDGNLIVPDDELVITSFNPVRGSPGSVVTILGENFNGEPGMDSVFFNGYGAKVISSFSNLLVAIVPDDATSGPITVQELQNRKRAVSSDDYEVIAGDLPVIYEVRPNSGVVGSSFLIIGDNFGTDLAQITARIGSDTTEVTAVNDTIVFTYVPVGATTGLVKVIKNRYIASGPEFTVLDENPVIHTLKPDHGPIGSMVWVIGQYFSSVSSQNTITLNGVEAEVLEAFNDSLKTSVPVGATTGNVVVTVVGVASNGVNFTVEAIAPQITSLTPNAGIVGSTVKIIGINFGTTPATNTVTFNGTTTTVTSASTTELVVTVPVGATTGNVAVTVGGVASNGVNYTVQATAPQITSLTPNAGIVGSTVKIIGTNFGATPASNAVTFNGTTTTVSSASTTELVVTVPVGATTGNVVVTVGGLASNGVNFTVQPTAPQITSLTPNAGIVGSTVKIVGTNFGATPASNTVTFNGTTATVTSASTTELVVTVPVGATTGNVVVTVGGLASNGVNFTVQPTAPQITSLTPNAGIVGSAVKIVGTNFGATPANNTVTFNGTTATVTSASTTEMVVTVPVGATTGNVVVTVGGLASNGVNFTVQPTAPQITSLTPNGGMVGSNVKIVGTNFSATPGQNVVTFNGTTTTVTSASAIELVVTVPVGATTGNVVVTVGGLASNGVNFTVQPTAPQITSLTPNAGIVGTSVKIVGTNFGATPATNTVTFNGTTATVTSASTTDLSVTVPVGATTGNVVVTVGGQASNGVNFTVQ